jgi:hypothetical protein
MPAYDCRRFPCATGRVVSDLDMVKSNCLAVCCAACTRESVEGWPESPGTTVLDADAGVPILSIYYCIGYDAVPTKRLGCVSHAFQLTIHTAANRFSDVEGVVSLT